MGLNRPYVFAIPLQQADDWRQEETMLADIISRDPLAEVSEQDKELLWKRRYM